MHKLTLLAALLTASVCTWAQSWTQPAAPEAMPLTQGAECYLYNVGAAGFYMGAYDWSTRACVKPTRGYRVYIDAYDSEIDKETEKAKEWDGESYYITSHIEDGSPAGNIMCLFISSHDALYVDRSKGDDTDKGFTFLPNGDGTYRIGLSEMNNEFTSTMYPNFYLGLLPSPGDTRLRIVNPDENPTAQIVWQFVSPDNYRKYVADVLQYEAAVALGAAIEDAQKRFPGVDISAVTAVYGNHGSTAEQLTAAKAELTSILLDHATPALPVDVTAAITNPDFDNNNRDGWDGTTPGFQLYGNAEFYWTNYDFSQKLQNLRPGVYTVQLTGFYRAGEVTEDGNEQTALEAGEAAKQYAQLYAASPFLSQVSTPLPFQSTGASVEVIGENNVSNGYGYLPNDMKTAYLYFEAGQYAPTSLTTYTADGTLTIGLQKQLLIAGDWTLFDHWKLYYLGNTEESATTLKTLRQQAHPDFQSLVDNGDIQYYGIQAYEDYKAAAAALEAAQDAQAILAAVPAFEAQATAFQQNADAYAAYYQAWQEACDFLQEHQADIMGDAVDFLTEYLWEETQPSANSPYPNGGAIYILNGGSLSTEQIIAETAYLLKLREAALAEGMADGMDCTELIKNPHFETAEGWVKEGLPEFPAGPESCRMGQAYSILFGVSQEITGLQNGLYELSLYDFFRPANVGSEDYAKEYNAYVFMNDFRQKMNHIEKDALDKEDESASQSIYLVGYVPNSLDEAAKAFQAGRYQQKVYGLVTDGIMRIGIRNDLRYEGCWAVFTDLKLTFRAKNPEVLAEVIETTIPTAQEMLTSKVGTAEIATLEEAIQAAQQAQDDARYDAMVSLKKAMDAVTASAEAYALLGTALDNLAQAIEDYPNAKDINAAKALYAETVQAYDNGSYDLAVAEQKLEEVGTMTVALKLGDGGQGEEQDFSDLIVNRNFDPAKGSKDQGRIDGWTTTAMNGYKEYTVSYNRAGFELYQDLTGLPKGKYKVTVHTYYRAGYWNEEEQYMQEGKDTHLTILYAQTSAGTESKPVMNLTEGAVAAADAPEGVKTYTLSNGLVAPDGTTPTAAFFAAGYYLNELEFTVPEDGKVRIGLSKTEVYPNDYEVVGEWSLYYYGDPDAEQREDYTALIVNPNFDPAKGSKDQGRIDGWTTTAMNGYKEYTVSYNRAGFELYQDITGLPAGNYEVTVHTYYRAGYWNEEEQYMQEGKVTHLTTLYAETSAGKESKPVMNLTEGAVAAADAPEGVKTYTLSNGLVAPDGTTPTAAFFAAGYYLNSLKFSVPADGKVRIGLSKTEVYPNDYEVVGAWHLYYLGKGSVDDAVNGIAATAAPLGIYDLNGVRSNRMQRGINIVRMPDGTVRKVMVK